MAGAAQGDWQPFVNPPPGIKLDKKFGTDAANALQDSAATLARPSSSINPKEEGVGIEGSVQSTGKEGATRTGAIDPIQSIIASANTQSYLENSEPWQQQKQSLVLLEKYQKELAKKGTTPRLGALMQYAANITGDKGIMDVWNQVQQFSPEDKRKEIRALEKMKQDMLGNMSTTAQKVYSEQLGDKFTRQAVNTAAIQKMYETGLSALGGKAAGMSDYQIFEIGRKIAQDTSKKGEAFEDDLTSLSKTLKLDEVGGLKAKIDEAKAIMNKYENIPGWGDDWYVRLGRSPELAATILGQKGKYSPEMMADITKLTGLMGRIATDYRHFISGTAASAKEAAELSNLSGESLITSDNQLRSSMGNLSQELAGRLRGGSVSSKKEIQDELWKRQGFTPDDVKNYNFGYIQSKAVKANAPSPGDESKVEAGLEDLLNLPTK